jgi:hypothetical protein
MTEKTSNAIRIVFKSNDLRFLWIPGFLPALQLPYELDLALVDHGDEDDGNDLLCLRASIGKLFDAEKLL